MLRTLELVKNGLKAANISKEVLTSSQQVFERCKENANIGKDIFEEVLPSKDASRTEQYKKAVEVKRKSGRVKKSMEAIMEDLVVLEQHQVFRDAETLEDIRGAIEELHIVGDGEDKASSTYYGSGHIYNHEGLGTMDNRTFNMLGSGTMYNSDKMVIKDSSST